MKTPQDWYYHKSSRRATMYAILQRPTRELYDSTRTRQVSVFVNCVGFAAFDLYAFYGELSLLTVENSSPAATFFKRALLLSSCFSVKLYPLILQCLQQSTKSCNGCRCFAIADKFMTHFLADATSYFLSFILSRAYSSSANLV